MAKELKGSVAAELSTDIATITAEINAYQRVAGQAIFEIGRRLKHVKENDLVHGEFGKWLKNIQMSYSQANRFMKVYEELDANLLTSRDLGVEALYHIATLPQEEREKEHVTSKGEAKTVDEMTVRELQELKKQLKESEQAKQQAESQAQVERQERERLEEENERLAKKTSNTETVVEYVEIDRSPKDYDDLKSKVADYEERFGDLVNYDDDRIVVTHVQEMTSATMSFKKSVKELIRRFSYMTKYKDAISRMDHISRQEYDETVLALHEFSMSFERVVPEGRTVIIEQ